MASARLRRPALGHEQWPTVITSANSIFTRRVGEATTPTDQKYAKYVANQLAYNNHSYDCTGGSSGPKFYGYPTVDAEGHTGVGVTSGASPTKIEPQRYTMAIWIVGPGQATQKIQICNNKGEPEPKGANHNLQSFFEEVPMPEVSKVPAGGLIPEEGTDGFMLIWQPSTDRLWEVWRLGVEGEGEYSPAHIWKAWGEGKANGKYTCRHGGFQEGVSAWNGVCPFKWGAMATSLAMHGGLITHQDLLGVVLGRPIPHALGFVVPNTAAGLGPVAPATRTDEPEQNETPELNSKSEPNPAFGRDAVQESQWFRFPPSSKASTYGLSKPLEMAIFNCLRDYGGFVNNGGSAPNFFAEWPGNLGSPYASANLNPYAGAPASLGSYPWIPSSMTNPAVPHLTEEMKGESSCFTKQPWYIFEQITPFSS
jgi:hypothetical protein